MNIVSNLFHDLMNGLNSFFNDFWKLNGSSFIHMASQAVAHRLLLQVCVWPICAHYNLTFFDSALFSCLSDHLYKTLPWFQQLFFVHLVSQLWRIDSLYRCVFGQSARTIIWPSLTLPCFRASLWSSLQDSSLVSAACFYSFGISSVAHRLLLQECVWPVCTHYNLTFFDFALFLCLLVGSYFGVFLFDFPLFPRKYLLQLPTTLIPLLLFWYIGHPHCFPLCLMFHLYLLVRQDCYDLSRPFSLLMRICLFAFAPSFFTLKASRILGICFAVLPSAKAYQGKKKSSLINKVKVFDVQ